MYLLAMTVKTSTDLSFRGNQKSPLGRSAVENTTGHGSLGEGPRKSKILQVSQALKPPLEETTEVKRKVVEDTSI